MTENAEALGIPFEPVCPKCQLIVHPEQEQHHAEICERVAAQRVRSRCDKCHGTGIYRYGTVLNGVPTKQGVCFRCRGKGHETAADQRRNEYYWDHVDLSRFA